MFDKSLDFLKKIKRNLFPFYKNKELQLVFRKLHQGFSSETIVARFVGGCVRKYLSNDKIDDIDIATILSTDEIKEKLKNTNFKVIETGVKHGTVTLVSQNLKLEVTTLRKDIETDGRHAEVQYISDWQKDSERRDFTINAIYLDIKGKIFDPQSGTIDLQNKNIKFIGDPQKRIEEDYLRIIRFIRFKIMYDTKVEPTTYSAIKQNLNGVKKISKERILIELYKILDDKNFIHINNSPELKEIFILIFPEFENLKRLDRLIKICDYSKVSRSLLLAVLLLDAKNSHEYFSHKYNVSNDLKNNLSLYAKNVMKIKENKDYFYKDLEKNVYLLNKNYLINLNIINFVINSKVQLKDFFKIFKKILKSKTHQLNIDGKYLIENGMQQGELVGKTLKKIEEEWINNNFEISKDRVQEIISLYSN